MKAAVVGGGTWGTAFSRLLADHGHEVTLVCRDPDQASTIAETGRNPRYLPGVDLRDVTADGDVPAGADVYVLAVPSRAFADVAAALPAGGAALSLTKGLDPASGERLSTLVRDRPVAVLSGPNMAEEIAVGLPSAAMTSRWSGATPPSERRSPRRSSCRSPYPAACSARSPGRFPVRRRSSS